MPPSAPGHPALPPGYPPATPEGEQELPQAPAAKSITGSWRHLQGADPAPAGLNLPPTLLPCAQGIRCISSSLRSRAELRTLSQPIQRKGRGDFRTKSCSWNREHLFQLTLSDLSLCTEQSSGQHWQAKNPPATKVTEASREEMEEE